MQLARDEISSLRAQAQQLLPSLSASLDSESNLRERLMIATAKIDSAAAAAAAAEAQTLQLMGTLSSRDEEIKTLRADLQQQQQQQRQQSDIIQSLSQQIAIWKQQHEHLHQEQNHPLPSESRCRCLMQMLRLINFGERARCLFVFRNCFLVWQLRCTFKRLCSSSAAAARFAYASLRSRCCSFFFCRFMKRSIVLTTITHWHLQASRRSHTRLLALRTVALTESVSRKRLMQVCSAF
jgi:hypothetical protein